MAEARSCRLTMPALRALLQRVARDVRDGTPVPGDVEALERAAQDLRRRDPHSEVAANIESALNAARRLGITQREPPH